MEIQRNTKMLSLFIGIVSFLAGGYYTYLSFPVSLFLVLWIAFTVKRNGEFRFWLSDAVIAIGAIVIAYGLTAFWAVDQGMAWWGLVKHIPLFLFVLAIMQLSENDTHILLDYVPISGGIMTAISIPLQFISALSERISPNGRLAGFFEYPNTYALYLLIGVIVLLTRKYIKKRDFVCFSVLLFGVFLSGSRTTFLLLIMAIAVICCVRREKKVVVAATLLTGAMMLLSILLQKLEVSQSAGRYLSTGTENSTLLCRILYFKDALRVISKNPFGLGYMGYSNLQGSFQSGVYHITYVHNELLQLLLDIGWIPVVLLVVAIFKAFFAKKAGYQKRLLMIAILGHCMMDFDLQYLSIWFLLISLLDLHEGKPKRLKKGKTVVRALSGAMLVAVMWLSTGDFLYNFGLTEACLSVTPFYTNALIQKLPSENNVDQLEIQADKVLALNSHGSLAYSARANVAYSRGDILGMVEAKQKAIAGNRYSLEEYLDYFDKLYNAMQLYDQQGDQASVEVCKQLILQIEEMIEQVKQETDPLAWKLQHTPELDFPQEYMDRMQRLRQ